MRSTSSPPARSPSSEPSAPAPVPSNGINSSRWKPLEHRITSPRRVRLSLTRHNQWFASSAMTRRVAAMVGHGGKPGVGVGVGSAFASAETKPTSR